MYPKNRIPMYEGDGFIHSGSIRDGADDSSVEVLKQNSAPLAERTGRSAVANELLHRLAVWIGIGVRHLQGKALEN